MNKQTRVFCLLLLAVSVLCPIVASYADVKDDIDFALGLAKRKYFDMAREVRDSIEKNPAATVAEKAELQMVSAQILRLEAEADPDPEKRERLLEEAIAQLEKFIGGGQGSDQRMTEARFTVGDLLTQRGRILTDRYQKEADPTQKAKLRQDAETRFKKAEEYFQKMIEYYERLADQKGVAIDDDVNLMEARRLLPTCKYFHSLLYGRGTPEQKKLLSEDPQVFPKGAVALFVEFIESYEGSLSAYEVSIYLGLCYLELGRADESDIWFDHVTQLKEEIEGVAEQHREMIWDVVFRAYYLKAKGLRGNGKHTDVVKAVNQMLATKKDAEKYDIVLAGMMEMAESLISLRQADKAVETAMKVAASNSPVKNLAIEFLSKYGGLATEVSPKGLLEMMRSAFGKKDYSKTIKQGRALLAAVARDNAEYVPETYMAIGNSYFKLGRFHEAAVAFARVYEDFPAYADASKAAYGAVGAWNEISGMTKNKEDKNVYLDAVKVLDSKYGSTPEAKNAPYLMGRADELEGKFLDAAKNYERVPKEAGMYEEAFARIGYCFFKHASAVYDSSKKEKDEAKKKALSDEAAKTFTQSENYYKKYVEHSAKSDDTVDEIVMQKREESRFVCLVGLALVYMHEVVKKPEEVIALFTEEELRRYSADPDKVARAHTLVMEAHIAGNRLAEAQSALEIVIAGAPGNKRIPGAARKIAIALDGVAKELKDKKKDEYIAMRRTMAKYYLIWLKNAAGAGEVVKAEHAYAVATKLLEIWKETGDNSYGQEAAPILEKTLAGGYAGKPPGKPEELKWRFAQVLAGLENWEKARDVYEDLAKTKSDNALIFLELGEVYLTLSRRTQGDDQKKYWQSGIDLFNRVLGSLRGEGKFSETWWRTMFDYVSILSESGEYKAAYEGIKGIRIEKPNFDEDQWGYKTKLTELLKKIETKMPK